MGLTDNDTPWRRCELAWMSYLDGDGYMVTRLTDLEGNAEGTRAPMKQYGGRLLRAPDIDATKGGRTTLWEIKYRKRAEINRDTGEPEYWMSHDSFVDYEEISMVTGQPLQVALLDRSAWDEDSRWRCASIQDIALAGRKETRFGAGGIALDAWVWPASRMELIAGPRVDFSPQDGTVFPYEGLALEEVPVEYGELAPIERARRLSNHVSAQDLEVTANLARVTQLIRAIESPQDGLEVLRLGLGIPEFPRYSVLRIGLEGVDLEDLLSLPRYGIRLFLVTDVRPPLGVDEEELLAFEESRLLEWAIVDGLDAEPRWIVDGRGMDAAASAVLRAGEAAGGINAAQYEIVHADADQDIIITAGAGTGKTETMSERILYLLATSPSRGPVAGRALEALRLDDIALITFSKDSAAEMRKRIARTLMLRQRLCRRSVLPTVAWLMQLAATDIDTIHAYAKKIVQRNGAAIGFAPGFRVSPQTPEFRRLVRRVLSPRLEALFQDAALFEGFPEDAPPAHEFDGFLEQLWDRLAGNGLSPLALPGTPPRVPVTWGSEVGREAVTDRLNEILREAMHDVAPLFAKHCVESQALPVDELVSAAKRAVDAADGNLRKGPSYIFIDEFQDTDQEQMAFILALRMSLDARLYAVGDPKQGVFRFRGAQGNALKELIEEALASGLSPLRATLTRNFRSDGLLLNSLDSWFSRWGSAQRFKRPILDYGPEDKLVPAASARGRGTAAWAGASRSRVPAVAGGRRARDTTAAVEVVRRWWTAPERASIAILCRWNSQAQRIRDELRRNGIPCEVRVGGHFFRTPAVREVAALLRATLHPEDAAALLQLCETRWMSGLQDLAPLPWLGDAERAAWISQSIQSIMPWHARVASLDGSGSFDRTDLLPLQLRLTGLSGGLATMPTLSWLIDCRERMKPDLTRLINEPDDGEVRRYGRCFDHLLALLDANFAGVAVSPHQALDWIDYQVATNTSEDEPLPVLDTTTSSVIAMTVHKAKGLEFDKVLVPFCSTEFGAPSSATAETALVSDAGTPTLLWRWSGRDNASPRLWRMEEAEVLQEEARLLYVAMTRARNELVIFTEDGDRSRETRWDDLLQ